MHITEGTGILLHLGAAPDQSADSQSLVSLVRTRKRNTPNTLIAGQTDKWMTRWGTAGFSHKDLQIGGQLMDDRFGYSNHTHTTLGFI